ncbi:MAG: rhodanese-like domain-containing protein [Motiliproteus sp.]
MIYTGKFQKLADDACSSVEGVLPEQVDVLIAQGAIALDIRDREEHDTGHIEGSLNISRGKLEMNIEAKIENLETVILCYCNAVNRGALSANAIRNMGYKNAKYINGGLFGYRSFKKEGTK